MKTHFPLFFATLIFAIAFCHSPAVNADIALTGKQVDYNRDIAPLLASHCYECHGPDANQRQANLRLDHEFGATGELDSGAIAVVAGKLDQSELWLRITSDDDDIRMPPPDSNKVLTEQQQETLRRWIDQGAKWSEHWSFARPVKSHPPIVKQKSWPRSTIDQFVLAKLESQQLTPAGDANQHSLIRRVYLDLIGLPPTPDEIQRFVADRSANAYENLVDRLLSSPRYGERWGRHWLDVARYGDSNGGDENHSYPLAYHYRDYVVRAWNADVPFNRFISEQIAGDLLHDADDVKEDPWRISATGFLAIGMKILAEQDSVKKQADIVDEQIDTLGRAFLGLSLGCARCHDHKFDPVSNHDYYALAGIFHSSNVSDQPIETADYIQAMIKHERRLEALNEQRRKAKHIIEQKLGSAGFVQRQAEKFDRGNIIIDTENYGKEIGIISDPGGQLNFVEYDFEVDSKGKYAIQLRYAAKHARPGPLSVDGKVVRQDAMARVTGGWQPEHQKWITEATCFLEKGKHVLRLESQPTMVHIDQWRLVKGGDIQVFDQLLSIEKTYAELHKNAPQPMQVMAVVDGQAHNVKIHKRGSHLDLGDEVPRRFIASLTPTQTKVPDDQSGRRELANWMCDDQQGAGFLAARVIVNRIWHWHFGHGFVRTTDDFGMRGERPSHPELLDYLTLRFIESGWSIKALNRSIVMSHTYQIHSRHEDETIQAVAEKRDPQNRLLWKFASKRMEPEVIRDSILKLTGQLENQMYGRPVQVKSQDPSPQDLANNLAAYESSRRRSVYLPIVRTNVYEFLTLFDFPNAASPVGHRAETVVPTQALFLMNSPYMKQQARRVAENILADDLQEFTDTAIGKLYLAIMSSPAQSDQIQIARRFLVRFEKSKAASDTSKSDAWTAFCHVLLMSNDFVYLH